MRPRLAALAVLALSACLALAAAVVPVFAAAPPARRQAAVRLRLSPSAERHIRARHFPGGRQTRGKSLFRPEVDLARLVAAAGTSAPRRQANGRDKRVVDAGRVIGADGRSGRPLRTYVVISEPDGLVITAYPGD